MQYAPLKCEANEVVVSWLRKMMMFAALQLYQVNFECIVDRHVVFGNRQKVGITFIRFS